MVCFQLLAIAIIPQMINSSAGSIFQAIGNTKLLFTNSCINTCITVVAIIVGVFVGKNIQTLAFCVAIAYLCHFATAFTMLIKMGFKYKISDFVKELIPELFILVVMLVAVKLYPLCITDTILSAMVKCVYLGVVYLAALFASKEYKLFVSLLKR